MRVETDRNGNITLRGSGELLTVSIIAFVMSGAGVFLFLNLIPERIADSYDIIGIVVLIVWICVILGLGVFSAVSYSKVLRFNEDGVFLSSIVSKKHYAWSDIGDWGLSYCGQTKGGGNTYYLYFSKDVLAAKSDKKKIKGNVLKIIILENEYETVVEKIVPYCKEHTAVPPFLPEIKFHLL